MELLIITGLSGAGKSKVINTLEDIGYYCVDNMPPLLLEEFVSGYYAETEETRRPAAVVVDARSGSLFRGLFDELEDLRNKNLPYKILYLDCSVAELMSRFKETRRRHPLLDECGGDLERAIREEEEILSGVLEIADTTIDTSRLTPQQLRERVVSLFGGEDSLGMLINVMSFGFRFGVPQEADLVFDVRCLPNPFYVPELREHDGTEECVARYVMDSPESAGFMQRLEDLLEYTVPLYRKEGKSLLVIAMGCTGGHHRSVAAAERIGQFLREKGCNVEISHRDVEKKRPR